MEDVTESPESRPMTLKDSVISLLIAKVNLSQDKAEQVFDIAMTYIKEHPYQLLAYIDNLRSGGAAGDLRNFFN